MDRQVRWFRPKEDTTAYVQVLEKGKWVHFRSSKIYKPGLDANGKDNGFTTFQNALRLGYTVISHVVNE